MHEDERPKPWLVATLMFVLPACMAVAFALLQWVSEAANRPSLKVFLTRSALVALLVMVPGALRASRRQAPGFGMFLLTLVPIALGIGIPLARHKGLVNPFWTGEAIAQEAMTSLYGAWSWTATGAFLSAQLAASYCLAAGLWPPRPARVSHAVLGVGRERLPLLLSGPSCAILAAAAWKLGGLRALPSDIAIWAIVAFPALVFALGSSKPRPRRDAIRYVCAAVLAMLLLALAAQAERVRDLTGHMLIEASQGRWYAPAEDLRREIMLRWSVAGIASAFALLALLPGSTRLRRHRRLRFVALAPVLLTFLMPALGALTPSIRVDRDVLHALRRWRTLLASRSVQLPSCEGANPAPIASARLAVVHPTMEPIFEGQQGGMLNVAVSGETPIEAVFRTLRPLALPQGASIEFLVSGCRGAGSRPARSAFAEMLSGNLGAVPTRVASKLDCAAAPESTVMILEPTKARVLRSACAPAPPAPAEMDRESAWKAAGNRGVLLGAAQGVSVAAFLQMMRGASAASTLVVTDSAELEALLDRAAKRDMLIDPGQRGAWKGTLLLGSVTATGDRAVHPEAVWGPVRGATDLYRCFDIVTTELPFDAHLDLAAQGNVHSARVEGEGTVGIAACLLDRLQSLQFGNVEGARSLDLHFLWYPPTVQVPEGLVVSGALQVRGDPDNADLRGVDGLAARLSPGFAHCIGDVLQTEPETAGSADIKVCVQPSGNLEPASADSLRIPLSALECMRDSVRQVRAAPEHLLAKEARCFRAIATLRNPNEDKVYHLAISVQEPEREASFKRDTGETENTYRANLLQADILGCYGRPADAPQLEGQIVLTAQVNRTGHVMSVSTESSGVLHPRMARCAVDAVSRMRPHVDTEGPPGGIRLGITVKVTTNSLR